MTHNEIVRLVNEISKKVDFILKTGRMKAALNTGVVGADGVPIVKHFEGSLLELYHLANAVETKLSSEDEVNG